MDTTVISFDLDTTNPNATLSFECWIDDRLVSNIDHVKELQHLRVELEDSDAQHQLKFVLKNKTWDHTKIDKSGNIVEDACLSITNIKFDDIELGQVFVDLAEYRHRNNNPDNEEIVDKFYRYMGCNGEVTLKFSTPIYLWLLESM